MRGEGVKEKRERIVNTRSDHLCSLDKKKIRDSSTAYGISQWGVGNDVRGGTTPRVWAYATPGNLHALRLLLWPPKGWKLNS